MAAPPAIAVVVTHLGGALLARCVAAIRADAPGVPIRVVVSSEVPVEVPSGVEAVRLGANPGFATAANAGLVGLAHADVFLLNDDTELVPGCWQALSAARQEHGEGLYQPRIELMDRPGVLDNTGHRLFPDGFNLARGRGLPSAAVAPPCGRAGAFSGAAVWLTAGARANMGDFDASFEAYGEDADLSYRAARRGIPIHYVPGACVRHALGATYGRVGARKVYLVERNRVRAAVRSLPMGALLTLPAWTGLRYTLMAGAAVGGRGAGAGVGAQGMVAAVLGTVAGCAAVPDAWRKRQSDRSAWTVGETGMWWYLWVHRARWSDLVGVAK